MMDLFPFLFAAQPVSDGENRPRPQGAGTAWRLMCWALLLAGVATSVWLTLKPSGHVPGARVFPEVAHWLNTHGRLRNVPAFFVLAVPALGLAGRRHALRAATGIAVAATVLELAQLAIRSRFFDPYDILLSWVGVLLCLGCFTAVHRLRVPDRNVPVPGASEAVEEGPAP